MESSTFPSLPMIKLTNICKDAGYGAIASHIELAGRVTMVVMSLPILFHVIDMVVRLMG